MFIGLKNIETLFGEYNSRLEADDFFHCLTNFCLLSDAVEPYTNHMLYVIKSIEEFQQCDPIPDMHVLFFTSIPQRILIFMLLQIHNVVFWP